MQALERKKTTAEQAVALEDGKAHPFRECSHSAQYFEILKSRRQLPISGTRQAFLDAYHENQVIVLSSDTGSGKTTQIPQFVFFDEFASGKAIACTQPRRLAATSVARRVADEMDVPLGQEVGYSVRFDNKTSDKTRLKYMTDGLLLREAMEDSDFSSYSCIIIDEAHERTMSTDILMALLKKAVVSRSDLQVIIMSATLDAEKFSNYFNNASTFEVHGRAYPVEILYLSAVTPSYANTSLHIVKHIHEGLENGDILLFLSTVEEIENACSALRAGVSNLEVLPLYSSLSPSEQHKIFRKSSMRKCIIATNVAEASLTIDGIVFVIDTGVCKRPGYNPRTGLKTLQTAPISKASARQRAGRAGRTKPGICYRMYDESTFHNTFLPSSPPGILEAEITTEILLLKAIGYNDVGCFDFIDRPHPEVYLRGIQELETFGFITTNGAITQSGRNASKLPLHPVWYNAIIEAHKLGCSNEMVSIAALGSTQNSIFLRPHGVRYVANATQRRFANPLSDHMTQLNALHGYVRESITGNINMEQWCFDAFINSRVVNEVIRIRKQVKAQVEQLLDASLRTSDFSQKNYSINIRKALARSFFYHSALHSETRGDDMYTTVHNNHPAGIHPHSALIGCNHEWVIYSDFIHTGKQYIQTVTAIDAEWIVDLEYFQDSNLSYKHNGVLRQPGVKASLDKARTSLNKVRVTGQEATL